MFKCLFGHKWERIEEHFYDEISLTTYKCKKCGKVKNLSFITVELNLIIPHPNKEDKKETSKCSK